MRYFQASACNLLSSAFGRWVAESSRRNRELRNVRGTEIAGSCGRLVNFTQSLLLGGSCLISCFGGGRRACMECCCAPC
jgi:hypothetical protein